MKRILVLLFFPVWLSAEIEEPFEQGTFPESSDWLGDTGEFSAVENDFLQMNADPDNGDVYISAPFQPAEHDSLEWEIQFALDFPPSANNRLRIYLASDTQNPAEANQAFFLQAGERGTDDAVELYHLEDNSETKIFRSSDGLARQHRDDLRIKVLYNQSEWTLKVDTLGTGLYQDNATGYQTMESDAKYVSFRCFYTSTRADRFTFDYLYAGHERIDTLPPSVDTVIAKSPDTLSVQLSKPVEVPGMPTGEHFEVLPHSIQPDTFAFDPLIPNEITLFFDEELPVREPLALITSGLTDYDGNVSPEQTDTFIYFFPVRNEIVVNEIMFDPSTATDLPDREFVELHNTTRWPVETGGWKLANDNSFTTLPEATIPGGGYLILCPTTATEDYEEFGATVGVANWPGFKIQEDHVTLRNAAGELMFHLAYQKEWLDDPQKEDESGWSLEMVDTENPCGQNNNWKASVHEAGGTPGDENSVKSNNSDRQVPFVERIKVQDSATIEVQFDQPLDSSSAADPENYTIIPISRNPDSLTFLEPGYSSIALHFDPPLPQRQKYRLETGEIENCTGNSAGFASDIHFGIPEIPERGDILLNEILFNTYSGGNEFVEIVNASDDKVFDLRELYVANKNEISGNLESVRKVSEGQHFLFPGDYKVLTRDPDGVLPLYETGSEQDFIQISPFISLTNDAGNIYLLTGAEDTIDRFHYHEDMHFDMLPDVEGVSLERIRQDRPSGDENNWHSAAEDAGFATPGLPNSQHRGSPEVADQCEVEPKVFAPGKTGLADFAELVCEFEETGYLMTVSVYNLRGQKITELTNNKFTGRETSVKWDGQYSSSGMLPSGTYLMVAEIVHPEGKTKTLRLPVTLSE